MNLRLCFFGLLLLGCAFYPASGSGAADQPPAKDAPTYTRDIASILFKNCAACHRPGEVAPFSLMTYADAKKRARLIQTVTGSRYMPPWKPVEGHGDFAGERRLSAEQVALIQRWAEAGAPEGEARDLPAPPKFIAGWQLGKPDLIVQMPKPFQLQAEGRDIYRNFVLSVKVPAGKYVKAVEYRPGNPRVVHHAAMGIDAKKEARQRDGQDGKPGFDQINLPGGLLPGALGVWVPGFEPRPLPDGFAMPWNNDADLVLQLHLHPSGKPESEQSTIGFYLTDVPPKRSLQMILLSQAKIDIPAGDKAYRSSARSTLPGDTEVFGVFAHMHLIGKETRVTARLPNGTEKSLLRIDDWDFKWQNYYEFKAPVALPKGTELVVECVHDNSADNPHNPSSPPRRVTFGEQTTNEMAAAVLHVASARGAAAVQAPAAPDDKTKEALQLIQQYDKDGDGKLSAEEIARIPAAAAQDVKQLFKRFDKDGDGKLDAKELAEALRVLRGK